MNPEVIFPLILAAVLLAVLGCTARLFRAGRKVLTVAFFVFAVACTLLSTLYWVAYDLLRPETRMPFAANEICEWALFLLLASMLRAVFPGTLCRARAAVSAALLAAANTALWIAWSGEWMQDILTGLSFGWLLYVLIACLLASDAFTRTEWTSLGAAAFLLIAAQTASFFAPAASRALDTACSVLLLAADVWLVLKTILSVRNGMPPRRGVCLSLAAFVWSAMAMYMSGGWGYYAALLMSTLCYPLMLRTMEKEVAAE